VKSIIITGLLTASLALSANAAMAAPTPANPIPDHAQTFRPGAAPVARAPAYRPEVFAGGYSPRNQLGFDVGQFIQGMLGGGPVPYANLVRDVRNMHASPGSYEASYSSPSYDTSPTVSSNNDAQAASDQEAQQIQQMNDENALIASMQAAEEQNDEANAATLQTEINAGF
jgi:hypothetical protein